MPGTTPSLGGHLQTVSQRVGRAISSLRRDERNGERDHQEENKEKEAGEDEVVKISSTLVDITETSINKKTMVVLSWMRNNLLLSLTFAGICGSLIIGLTLRLLEPSPTVVELVSFPGEIFVRMLKMLILPLIVCSLITGMAKMDPVSSCRMGIQTLVYYTITTIIAVFTGVVVVLTIHPGDPEKRELKEPTDDGAPKITTLDAILDILRNTFPDNIVQASFQQIQTVYEKTAPSNNSDIAWKTSLVNRDGTNVMGIIIFSLAFGFIARHLGKNGDLVVDFFLIVNEIIMKLVKVIMWYSPFGILCLITGKIISQPDLAVTASQLGLYMTAVIVGLFIHATITLPGIYFLMTKKNPLKFFMGMLQAWFTALATASSAASLPVTFHCLEVNNGIDERVTRFVTSVGSGINKDGTALYEVIAAIYIAQMNDFHLGIGSLLIASLTAILASVGAAAIPSTALVTLILVLSALGLPSDDISLLIAVDWILDRIRTSINVLGNAYGAGIIYHLVKYELHELDTQEENSELKRKSENETVGNNERSMKKSSEQNIETNI